LLHSVGCSSETSLGLSGKRGLLVQLFEWWSGAHIETAWSSLHAASEALLSLAPSPAVKARIPDIAAAVRATFKTADPRLKTYSDALAAYQTQQSLSNEDIREIVAIHHAANTASDMAHTSVRSYRNLLFAVGLALSLALILLAALHALAPGFLSMQTRTVMPRRSGRLKSRARWAG
jgi:hypothetical protein